MKEKKTELSYSSLKGLHRAVPILLIALAVFVGLCFILQDMGIFGKATGGVMLGLFSYGAYSVPVLLLIHALFYPSDLGEKRVLTRTIFSSLTVIFISALCYTFANWGNKDVAFSVKQFYLDGQNHIGGGFVGGVLGFAITKLIGSVGMVILAAAIFALYVAYFFSQEKNVFMAVIRGIIRVCAFIERKIKKLAEKNKAARLKRKMNRSQKNNEKLTEDEFFAADSSIRSLSIDELGINESLSAEAIEHKPQLQEKVIRRSLEGDRNEDIIGDGDYMFFTPEEEKARAESTVKRVFKDIDIDFETEDSPTEPAAFKKTLFTDEYDAPAPAFTDGDSAESVFNSSFDPFNFAKADILANKASSKIVNAATEPLSFNGAANDAPKESADEEQRAQRLAEFERRREQLKEMKLAQEAAKAKTEAPKTVEFTVSNNSLSHDIREDDASVSTVIDKNSAEQMASYNPFKNDFSINSNKAEEVAASESQAFGAAENSRTYTNRDISSPAAESPRFVFEVDKSNEKEEIGSAGYAKSTAEFAPAFDGASENEDTEATENISSSPDRVFNAERKDGYNGYIRDLRDDEDEDEEDLTDYPGEELLDDGEEIPPEEQSEAVKGYRDMFAVFREEEEEEPATADTVESAPDSFDGGSYDSDDVYTPEVIPYEEEVEKEQDAFDAPFDLPAVPVAPVSAAPAKAAAPAPKKKRDLYKNYRVPPLDLLGLDEAQDDEQMLAEIKENTSILIETLQSFNVTASIKGVDKGPRITRYEVVPAKGVKVNAITHLFQDIELNLAAEGIRMEAPIPGKSAIGFEIPNKHPANVRLRELLETEEFQNARSVTYVCIGKDVAGNPIFGDIAKYPHVLVAGATGMGKSVCINSIMISMLYKARPDEVKFIMIDPKKVEFKMYSGIPHLLIPVITEAKQAAGALMWAVEEMERRYDLIEENYVRNIDAYNEKVKANPSIGDPIPKIVIVIDELNDLMMQVRDPVEDLIMRIAQKARAAGIHLIIGTQRPSVNVITGTIKANINTRISCKVSSQVDSRTILEMAGAEKLLNRGDMLYKPVDRPKPIRVQGAFVSDPEVEAIMDFLKSQGDGAQYDDEVFAEINRAAQKCNKKSGGASDDDGGEDDQVGYYNDQQFLDGVELAIRSGKISTALLQRKLSIGYGKAARYIDAMVEIGIVSEPNGSKPRDVLITMDEWHEKLSRVNFDD